LVSSGSCLVTLKSSDEELQEISLKKFDHYLVPVGHWHQICNPFEEPAHIIEIQYGEKCIEEDIERINL
jgi:mannose-6-phosphate isomerase-like protein (cupin superfamily)